MKIYLQDDVIFYNHTPNAPTTYWLEVELFEHAKNNSAMLSDLFIKKWYNENVVEQTIHCLMEARPNTDWSTLRSDVLENAKGSAL
jgi:hypothetical protein